MKSKKNNNFFYRVYKPDFIELIYIQIILVFSLCSGVPQTRMKFAKGRFSFLIFIMIQLSSG